MRSQRRWLRVFAGSRTVACAGLLATLAFVLIASATGLNAQPPSGDAKRDAAASEVKLGLSINDPKAFQGYTLLNPMGKKTTYLLDMQGKVVKTWQSEHNSMHAAYLLEDGHLLRVAMLEGEDRTFGAGPGAAGRIQEFDWDGQLVWDFQFHTDKLFPHHDVTKLPNGNFLMIAWNKKTADEAIAAGRKKELVSNYLLSDSLIEIKPTGKTTGEIVWEWHLWDHLVQDQDASKANYGEVAAHPELVDINFAESSMGPGPGGPPPAPAQAAAAKKKDTAEAAKLKTIGYVGSQTLRDQRVNPDWTHVNSIAYNPELDQVVISIHEFSEIWIIDHSTTKAESASHQGGRSGKGGDLLYRWGNPRIYRAGTLQDQRLFAQHNAHWIPRGLPGEGHMLVFNNGGRRPGGDYSSVDELVLPVDGEGHYTRSPGAAYLPDQPVWSYSAPKKSDFNAFFISGASRLPNGNTLICSGPNGTIFEVTPDKQIVWKYVNPVKGGFGPGGPGGPPQPNQILPVFLQDMMGLSADQKKQLADLQKQVDDTIAKTLTPDQNKKLRERSGPGPGAPPTPGQLISTAAQITLKTTPDQRKQLADLQKQVDTTLAEVLSDEQKKQFKQMRADFARGGPPGGGPGGPPGGPGGPPGGGPGGPAFGPGGPGFGPGGPPAFLFAGPPGGSALFRAYRYGPDYPGLVGKKLVPGKTVEELQTSDDERKAD